MPRDNSSQLAKIIVGQWEWKEGPENCRSLVNMAFKSDGTYTRTSESCDFADDGFGNFYYGWYVVNEHICFLHIDEQFEDEKPRSSLYKSLFIEQKKKGFVKESCPWKIENAQKTKVVVTEQYSDVDSSKFTMVRKSWL